MRVTVIHQIIVFTREGVIVEAPHNEMLDEATSANKGERVEAK